jgi:Concanavalin A-like lectin/glucanases superfamily
MRLDLRRLVATMMSLAGIAAGSLAGPQVMPLIRPLIRPSAAPPAAPLGANFNGQQYVDIPKLAITSPALTVSLWFRPLALSDAAGSNPRLLANSHTDVDAKGFQLQFNSGGGLGFFDVGNGTASGTAAWKQQLVAGQWYHYAGVYDGQTVSAWLNGVQVASAAFAGGAIAAGTGPDINIGRNPTYGYDWLTGSVADVRVYERALAAADIAALYEGTAPAPAAASAAAAWALAPWGISGSAVADASGNGYAGNVVGGPLSFTTGAVVNAPVSFTITSADGAVATPGSGQLITSEGSWSLSTSTNANGDNVILLNGQQAGWAQQLQVTNGKLYALQNAKDSGDYWVRLNGAWTKLTATAPIEGDYATAVALNPASAKTPDNAAAGTVITTAQVTTASGGKFTGILQVTGDAMFGANGMNVVLARGATQTDDGTHNFTVTAID